MQINVGKDGDEYNAIVNTMTDAPRGHEGARRRDRRDDPRANRGRRGDVPCKEANVPRGLLFVPYGPPTCQLMGGETDGTGMPTSKGWEVEVEAG